MSNLPKMSLKQRAVFSISLGLAAISYFIPHPHASTEPPPTFENGTTQPADSTAGKSRLPVNDADTDFSTPSIGIMARNIDRPAAIAPALIGSTRWLNDQQVLENSTPVSSLLPVSASRTETMP